MGPDLAFSAASALVDEPVSRSGSALPHFLDSGELKVGQAAPDQAAYEPTAVEGDSTAHESAVEPEHHTSQSATSVR